MEDNCIKQQAMVMTASYVREMFDKFLEEHKFFKITQMGSYLTDSEFTGNSEEDIRDGYRGLLEALDRSVQDELNRIKQ